MRHIVFIISIYILFFQISFANDQFKIGEKIFYNKGNCSSCHYFGDKNIKNKNLINLSVSLLNMDQINYKIVNGVGQMPAYIGILDYNEINALSYYVYKNITK